MSQSQPALPLGYTMLPRGQIATLVTYLEMTRRPPQRPSPAGDGLALRAFGGSDIGAYRKLFRRVGEEWLWCSRLIMADAQLKALLADPKVKVKVLLQDGQPAGLLELDFRGDGECELAYFGLAPEAIGRGAGRYMMNEAIAMAWTKPIRRFFVHTCSLDHPAALDFYRRSGFRPYALAVEVLQDPRLAGLLPLSAAAHVPLIEA